MRLSMLLALMLLAACSDDGGATLDQGQPDMAQVDLGSADAALDTMQVPDLAPPDLGPTPPTLIDTHTGWKQALCFTCHAGSTYPHGSQSYKEPDCAQCHGYNGAPHKSHATTGNSGCMNCHSSTSHASSFTAPADCVACHFHPG